MTKSIHIMTRLISIVTLIFITSVSSHAQLLYEISGNSSRAKSYIFATNRLADIQFLDSVPNLFKVYGRCDKVITEMAINDYEAIAALRTAALLPDSVRIEDWYSEDEYTRIDEALRLTMKLGLDKLGRMKPSYLTELYRNELLRRWLNYDEDRSMENFFQSVAAQQDRPIYSLDNTGEAIYMAFDREPLHWQMKELLKIVEYPEREIRLEKSILGFYRNGQLNELVYEASMPDNTSTLSYSDCKVYWQRNITWVKRLKPYLHEGHAFICLNALYLGGDEGLLAQLKEAGYKVQPFNRKTNPDSKPKKDKKIKPKDRN